jgi:hypothetical protein
MPTSCKEFQEVIDELGEASAKVQLQLAEQAGWSESRTRVQRRARARLKSAPG